MDKRLWTVFGLGVVSAMILFGGYLLSMFLVARTPRKLRQTCPDCGQTLGFLFYCKQCDNILLLCGIILIALASGVIVWVISV